ncbi:MAG: alpha/beta hydrolase [Alphaproteobacteria bacterium]|jgi:proline iminopeptidase|nr:alpha/beta hydrolase [Alphaproteobacteria bacterium]
MFKKIKSFWKKMRTPKPFKYGYMETGDGHQIYYAIFGNKKGTPIINFNGGPAWYFDNKDALRFNLKSQKVIMFDQRGGGRSLPYGEAKNNETKHLISDAKKLLSHLNIDQKVIVTGTSWGSALAVLFASKYPKEVSKLVLKDFFNGLETVDKWIFEDSKSFYPELYNQFIKDVPKGTHPFEYYNKQLHSKKYSDRKKAANNFTSYEFALGSLNPNNLPKEWLTERFVKQNQLKLHYMVNKYFMKKNEVVKTVSKIKHIPCIIIHNRLDMICPVEGAYNFAKDYGKKCKLIIVDELGHGGLKNKKEFVKQLKKL